MCKVGYDKLKDAIKLAEGEFERSHPHATSIDIDGGPVPIMYSQQDRGGITIESFGLPAIWKFDGSQKELERWWKHRHPETGVFLRPEWKRDLGWQANLQYTRGDKVFNYHVAVPDGS